MNNNTTEACRTQRQSTLTQSPCHILHLLLNRCGYKRNIIPGHFYIISHFLSGGSSAWFFNAGGRHCLFIFTGNVAVGSRFLNPSPALLGAGVTFLCSSVSLGQGIDHLSNEGQRSVLCRAVEGQWRQWE